jgi:hypothetical protein
MGTAKIVTLGIIWRLFSKTFGGTDSGGSFLAASDFPSRPECAKYPGKSLRHTGEFTVGKPSPRRIPTLKNDVKCPDRCGLVRRMLKEMQKSSM